MTTRARVACFLVLLCGTATSLEAQRLPIRTYTTADGLAHNAVNRIVRDSRGFLWFCTEGGLSRYDGYAFVNFGTEQGLPNSFVTDLLETRAGEYWVATRGGLVLFDPRGSAGTVAPMFAVISSEDEGDRSSRITVLREGRDDTLWVGTNRGLYRLRSQEGRQSLQPVDIQLPSESLEQRTITDVLEDAGGALWIASGSGLYHRRSDGATVRYTERDGLPNIDLSDLLEDHRGQLWAGTRLGGFFRFRSGGDGGALVVDQAFSSAENDPNGLPTNWVFQLFETSDHRFWVASSRGVVEFFPAGDDQGRLFRAYDQRHGLSYFDITALNEDLGGNLWLGTNTAGAMKLTRGGFNTFGRQDGIETMNAVFEDRTGRLCFRGVALENWRGDQIALPTRVGCLEEQRVNWFQPRAVGVLEWGYISENATLQARSGEWWVGTGRGLFRFRAVDDFRTLRTATPIAWYTPRDGLATWQVFRLFEDSRGRVWVSTISSNGNGLAFWDPESGRLRDVTGSDGLPSFKDDRPRAFAEDAAGNVWMGFNDGLVRHTAGTFTLFRTSDGLPAGSIMNIHADRAGRLWLTSARSGLIRVDHGASPRPRFIGHTVANGLSSNNADLIAEDLNGRLYIAGGRGLDQFDPASGRVRHFTTADGLPPGVFLAAFRDRGGVLWFGTSGGLARLDPALDRPSVPAPVFVTGLRISGVSQPVSALGEEEMSLSDLGPDRNQIEVDFVGLGFEAGEILRYQYRLTGTNTDWSTPSDRRSVTFASLAPGRYQFEVRAINSGGMTSGRPAAIAFTILSPVWLRWWFLMLAAIAVGLMVHAVYRYRLARLMELIDMRTRIATDLHDDIGANLTRISMLSEAGRMAKADGPLEAIASIARESVSSMSDIVWAINPRRESLRDLTRRMRQHADEVFTLREIALTFTAPAVDDGLKLGVDVRRDVLLIFKEAVNNAARHAECSHVTIDFGIEDSRLVLSVADDGAGFDQSVESDGHGLLSMRRRAERLKGTLTITSRLGSGTTVLVSVPF